MLFETFWMNHHLPLWKCFECIFNIIHWFDYIFFNYVNRMLKISCAPIYNANCKSNCLFHFERGRILCLLIRSGRDICILQLNFLITPWIYIQMNLMFLYGIKNFNLHLCNPNHIVICEFKINPHYNCWFFLIFSSSTSLL